MLQLHLGYNITNDLVNFGSTEKDFNQENFLVLTYFLHLKKFQQNFETDIGHKKQDSEVTFYLESRLFNRFAFSGNLQGV